MTLMIAPGHALDLKEHGKRSAKCTHCGKRGRAKCQVGVCLNFCCMTKKMNSTTQEGKVTK